jgi:hypothetical protein
MGYRVSWIARSGTSTHELLAVSDRSVTQERHEFPDVGWYLLELPNTVDTPWVLLIADGSDNYAELDPSHARELSNGGNETLYFWCSDTVMATELMCFKNGAYSGGPIPLRRQGERPEFEGAVPSIAHEYWTVCEPSNRLTRRRGRLRVRHYCGIGTQASWFPPRHGY